MKDGEPGIDLDAWLNSSTKHGFPSSKIKQGGLYYFAPIEGSVAGFSIDYDITGAHASGALLSGDADPDFSDSGMGVSNSEMGVFACAAKPQERK